MKIGSSETSKVFIRKKWVYMERHKVGLRLLCLHGSLNHLYGTFLLGFLWPATLLCLVLSHIWFISGSSGCVCVCVCVLAKMDSSKEAYT